MGFYLFIFLTFDDVYIHHLTLFASLYFYFRIMLDQPVPFWEFYYSFREVNTIVKGNKRKKLIHLLSTSQLHYEAAGCIPLDTLYTRRGKKSRIASFSQYYLVLLFPFFSFAFQLLFPVHIHLYYIRLHYKSTRFLNVIYFLFPRWRFFFQQRLYVVNTESHCCMKKQDSRFFLT